LNKKLSFKFQLSKVTPYKPTTSVVEGVEENTLFQI
jgi:hypothetical protein